MALVLKDRVKETSTTSGTGTLTLGGAVDGFQSFSVIGDANTTYYAVFDSSTNDWEVGLGTYSSAGGTLTRDQVLESSNSGNLVDFSSASKIVFCTYPAEKALTTDDIGTSIQAFDSTILKSTDIGVTVQANLVSGTNIKTVNGENLLGSGNVAAGISTGKAIAMAIVFG
jgi:hypothetical protein